MNEPYAERLIAWNMYTGKVEIHEANCNHRVRKDKRQDQVEFGLTDWTSQYAFAHDYWDNGILAEHEAEHGVGSFDVFHEMDFKPCVKLPRNEPKEETEMAQNNKAPVKAKSAAETAEKTEKKELPGKAPNEVPPPRSAKSKALPGGLCRCGCGREVGRTSTFAQGHDAKFVSQLIEKIDNGTLNEAAALHEAGTVSEALAGKLGKAIKNAADAKDKAEAAAKAKEDKAAKAAAVKAAAKAKPVAKPATAEVVPADEAESDEDDDLDIEDTGESDEDDDF